MNNVKLFGAWPSPFNYIVIWALELKGIKYDYIEEDLTNKSSFLLKYNPIYKKIPILVHNEKPICESLIILEYLEEMSSYQQHLLLPKEPYERAMVRFWAKFADEKGITIWMLFRSTGEDHIKAKNDTLDMLTTIEDHALEKSKFFGGENIGLADLAVGSVIHWLEVIEQTLEVKLFEANRYPKLHKWFNNFKEVPIIEKNLPDQHQMFTFFQKQRERLMESTTI